MSNIYNYCKYYNFLYTKPYGYFIDFVQHHITLGSLSLLCCYWKNVSIAREKIPYFNMKKILS